MVLQVQYIQTNTTAGSE